MKRILLAQVIFALLAPVWLWASGAGATPQTTSEATTTTTTKKTTTKRKAPAKPARPTIASQLQKLQEQLESQSRMIDQQQSQIQQLQQSNTQLLQHVQTQDQQLRTSVEQLVQKANNTDTATAALTSQVSEVKASTTTVANNLIETQKTTQKLAKEFESPLAIHFKGVTLTPGGWLEVASINRVRNENADQIGVLGTPPFNGTANAHLSEFRFTARGSRPTLLVEGKLGGKKITGYWELDFLSQAPTANQLETNSFNPRQRQLFAQVEFENGTTYAGGQMWSLLVTDRKGMLPRSEFIPTTIEGSYVIGYTYVRQAGFRVIHNFNNKTWAGFSLENPETSFNASFVPPDTFGLNSSANALSPVGGNVPFLAGFTNGFSTNLTPDVIGKLAFEPGFGHYEIKGLGRFFRDRRNGDNRYIAGGGIGFGMILPVKAKKADFVVEGLWGRGIGRYGAANNADITLKPDGAPVPLRSGHALAGLELHPKPKLDIYIYGGDEYYYRNPYTTVNASGVTIAAGYGSPLANNTNCTVEVVPTGGAACGAQNRNVWQATGGFWYRFAKGPYGTLQYGAQYEYLQRNTWAAVGGAPQGNDNVLYNSFRYILP